jgi:DNA ligase (NAD+)
LPLKLKVGEAYRTPNFERINAEREEAGDPRFANPRNAASGTIRQLDPSITPARLEMFAYDVFAGQRKAFATHWDALNWPMRGISRQRESRVMQSVEEADQLL